MPFLSLDERIRGWRLKLTGQREENATSVTFEGDPQQGRCRRVTHADGRIFWAYLWTSPAQDTGPKRLDAALTLPQTVPEAEARRHPAA